MMKYSFLNIHFHFTGGYREIIYDYKVDFLTSGPLDFFWCQNLPRKGRLSNLRSGVWWEKASKLDQDGAYTGINFRKGAFPF